MLVGEKGLTCVGGKLFFYFRVMLRGIVGSIFSLTAGISFSHRDNSSLSRRVYLSLTEHTDLTEPFGAHFEPTEGLRHTDITEAFQLTLAVTFCDIG